MLWWREVRSRRSRPKARKRACGTALLGDLGAFQVLHLLIEPRLHQHLGRVGAAPAQVLVLAATFDGAEQVEKPAIDLHVVPAGGCDRLRDDRPIAFRKHPAQLGLRELAARHELRDVLGGAREDRAFDRRNRHEVGIDPTYVQLEACDPLKSALPAGRLERRRGTRRAVRLRPRGHCSLPTSTGFGRARCPKSESSLLGVLLDWIRRSRTCGWTRGDPSQMNDEIILGQKAREAIQAGRLPDRCPDRTWGGKGTGADCVICGSRVTHDDAEFEIEFALAGAGTEPEVYRLHARCFRAWDLERQSLELGRRGIALERPPAIDCDPDGNGGPGSTERNAPAATPCRKGPMSPSSSAMAARRTRRDEGDRAKGTLGDLLYADKAKGLVAEKEWVTLVHAIVAGDQGALHALYERTHRIVFTLILRITRNRETAEELTLDVFHDVWRRASKYDPAGGSVVGWIMNQARSRAIDRLRFEQRKKRVDPHPDERAARPCATGPHDALELGEQSRVLRDALDGPYARRAAGDRDRVFLRAHVCGGRGTARISRSEPSRHASVPASGSSARRLPRGRSVMSATNDDHGPEHGADARNTHCGRSPRARFPSVEAHIADCAECRQELATLRPIVDAFVAWPTDVLRPSASLWDRLSQRIAAETGREPALPSRHSDGRSPSGRKSPRASRASCSRRSGERSASACSCGSRPGADYPPHSHAGVEELHLLDGELSSTTKAPSRGLQPRGAGHVGPPGLERDRLHLLPGHFHPRRNSLITRQERGPRERRNARYLRSSSSSSAVRSSIAKAVSRRRRPASRVCDGNRYPTFSINAS